MMETIEHAEFELFRKGDTAAFGKIYKCYYRRLCYFAIQLVGDQAQAEDIVADSMIKLWERHSHFQYLKNVKAFLYITTRNACLDYLRRRSKQLNDEKDWAYASDNKAEYVLTRMIEAELLHVVNQELEHLPAKARTVLKLTYLNGCSTVEVASQLNMTQTAVRNNKFRALEALRLAMVKRRVLDLAWLSLVIPGLS